MAALGKLKRLAVGSPVKLNDSAITTTGTLDFNAPPHDNEAKDFSLLFQFKGTATNLTAALQVSLDGGTTFVDYKPSAQFINGAAGPVAVIALGVGNALFRVNITTATGVNGNLYVCSN